MNQENVLVASAGVQGPQNVPNVVEIYFHRPVLVEILQIRSLEEITTEFLLD